MIGIAFKMGNGMRRHGVVTGIAENSLHKGSVTSYKGKKSFVLKRNICQVLVF
ncbi:unnamed protein product [Rodentolepis nana]|uniref:Transposase n=1 Tax=Rodentolepis nana TaxID=102285 RepID=A0A0R3T0X6_RODNA|nr:unnamed protein product [Rodentolepis nana]